MKTQNSTGIRLHKMRERSLKALAYLYCVKPADNIGYENCYWDELRAPVSIATDVQLKTIQPDLISHPFSYSEDSMTSFTQLFIVLLCLLQFNGVGS
jgi:hypothetical protein